MTNKLAGKKNWKSILIAAGGVLLLLGALVLVLLLNRQTRGPEPVLADQIASYSGYIRQVEQDEYDFYQALVKRDLTKELDAGQLDLKVKEYINHVNAAFYLGNKLGFCEPYSFSNLQNQMKNENASRKVKKEKGEPVYGLSEFDLLGYYQYAMSNLRLNLVNYFVEHADQKTIEQAKEYYAAHTDVYRQISSVTYSLTEKGETSIKTATAEDLRTLQNLDGTLFDFLTQAGEGETFSYETSESVRDVQVTSVSYTESSFEDSKSVVLRDYIDAELYDRLISVVAENNPVEFA